MTALHWVYVSIAALAALYLLWVILQVVRPAALGAGMMLPFFVLALLPYAYIALRLRADPHASHALGLAVYAGMASIAAIIGAYLFIFMKLSPFVAIMLTPVFLVFGAFGLIQAGLIRAALAALAADGQIVRGLASGLVPVLLLVLAYTMLGWPAVRGLDRVHRNTSFSETTAQKHLAQVYRSLWRQAGPGAVNGFPASAEGIARDGWDETVLPGGSAYGTYFDWRYEPGPPEADGRIRSFLVAVKKRSRRRAFTDSYSLDEKGTLRRSVEGWAGRDARVYYETNTSLAALMAMCDAYHELHGCYPRRLVMVRPPQAKPGEMALPHNSYIAPARIEYRPDGTSDVYRYNTGPAGFSYRPQQGERPQAYTVNYPGERSYTNNMRSYFTDEAGRVHVTPEPRDAHDGDPLDETEEFKNQRAQSLEWAREYLLNNQ